MKHLENITNCPNCGAIITGNKCEYCGTKFQDTQAEFEIVTLYADDEPIITVKKPIQKIIEKN